LLLFFFFFFQAEDGIRDYKVTGVQTCALPISSAYCFMAPYSAIIRSRRDGIRSATATILNPPASLYPFACCPPGQPAPMMPARRSEERRVGKECRSRWSREQEKKKERG